MAHPARFEPVTSAFGGPGADSTSNAVVRQLRKKKQTYVGLSVFRMALCLGRAMVRYKWVRAPTTALQMATINECRSRLRAPATKSKSCPRKRTTFLFSRQSLKGVRVKASLTVSLRFRMSMTLAPRHLCRDARVRGFRHPRNQSGVAADPSAVQEKGTRNEGG